MKRTVQIIFILLASILFCSAFGQRRAPAVLSYEEALTASEVSASAPAQVAGDGSAPAPAQAAGNGPAGEAEADAAAVAAYENALLPGADSQPSTEPAPAPPEETPFVKPLPEAVPYSDGEVSAGAVRYVSQLNEPEKNGWGKYAWKAGMECTTACVSMAMSYIGIDASPEALLDYSSKTVLTGCFGVEGIEPSRYSSSFYEKGEAYPAFERMAEEYLSDTGTEVSPVLVYLTGSGHYHAFLVIGKGEGDDWYVLDPTPAGIHTVRITDEGKITTDEDDYLTRYTTGEESPASIVSLAQWRLCGEEEKT